jgi:hypothetical protein
MLRVNNSKLAAVGTWKETQQGSLLVDWLSILEV